MRLGGIGFAFQEVTILLPAFTVAKAKSGAVCRNWTLFFALRSGFAEQGWPCDVGRSALSEHRSLLPYTIWLEGIKPNGLSLAV